MATSHLEATQFVPIEPGETIETEIDVAELYGKRTSTLRKAKLIRA